MNIGEFTTKVVIPVRDYLREFMDSLDPDKCLGSLSSAFVATLVFTTCFTMLGLFSEGSKFMMGAVYLAGACFFTIDMFVLALFALIRFACLQGGYVLGAPYEMMPDEPDRLTFHWSFTHGFIVVMLASGFYGLTSHLLMPEQTYYGYLMLCLIPVAPWLGKAALDYNRDLVGPKSITALFFHRT